MKVVWIGLALMTSSLVAQAGSVAAAATKQSNPVLVKATVTAAGCKVMSPGTSTTYYQKGQSVTVTPNFPSFTVASDGTVSGNPAIVEVVIQCSPGFTVTGTLATTNFQFQGSLSSTETFIASGPATPTLNCSSLVQKNALASGTAPTTGNATPMVYLWYGACGARKNNWSAGTYTVIDAVTVTFN